MYCWRLRGGGFDRTNRYGPAVDCLAADATVVDTSCSQNDESTQADAACVGHLHCTHFPSLIRMMVVSPYQSVNRPAISPSLCNCPNVLFSLSRAHSWWHVHFRASLLTFSLLTLWRYLNLSFTLHYTTHLVPSPSLNVADLSLRV